MSINNFYRFYKDIKKYDLFINKSPRDLFYNNLKIVPYKFKF